MMPLSSLRMSGRWLTHNGLLRLRRLVSLPSLPVRYETLVRHPAASSVSALLLAVTWPLLLCYCYLHAGHPGRADPRGTTVRAEPAVGDRGRRGSAGCRFDCGNANLIQLHALHRIVIGRAPNR